MLVRQRRRQRKFQNLSTTQSELCGRSNFLVFCENFGPRHDLFLAPNDQVRSALRYAAFLCAPNKIVESIQGTLQLFIRKHAGQARYCQRKQQHHYEHSENNLDQRKTPQPLHRRTYSIEAKSRHGSGRRGDLVSASPKRTWILSSDSQLTHSRDILFFVDTSSKFLAKDCRGIAK